jgi:excisionase family DNA binding protein
MDLEMEERDKDRMLTVEDLRARLNIGRTKAWDLVYKHEIPAVRVGRSVRLREQDVVEYLERNAY